ncbi:probable aminotransferase TAT2 [Malania oleifera]|uniref:probable aminotransferase TAT2 n=1 Tax=Malania oleifera TaxID=397392 RepID=UPI0025AE10C7|nr:probable aminotransferase TAT2 [Malania oleifera]XP_057956447.1 probable aminotransferase TAT2 [Malania oleifera]XP_057956455.1 probable aminotransferase TAT2 [Malania oleifera]
MGDQKGIETERAPLGITIKGILSLIMSTIDEKKGRRVISLGMGDPSAYTCFHTTPVAEESVADALQSQNFNGYAPTVGLLQARIAIADYLSRDLPYKLSSDDVYITSGCTHAIDAAITNLYRPGANILLPRPGFPIYELCAAFRHIEVRHFDLIPERGWEVDVDAIEALADHNTVALVIINPGNPCGSVYSYHHLKKIAETAEKLRILVIADEVYGHLAFGKNPFVPMGVFGSTVPVLTLGSLSKRWIVPGWRLGWFVTNDLCGTFKNPKVVERLKKYFDICGGPATFIQAAVPRILAQTEEVFYMKTLNILKQTSDICCRKIKEIGCITCPHKPEGSMAVMVKLNLSLLKDVSDDIDFCLKLAKEESVIILPGTAVGLKNWLRITFAVEPSSLEEALGRVKAFYQRHANQEFKY